MNKDGTISSNENKLRRELNIRANEQSEKLFKSIKKKAYDIGGSFRGPGISHEAKVIIANNLNKYMNNYN